MVFDNEERFVGYQAQGRDITTYRINQDKKAQMVPRESHYAA